jgi:hypothetical protein
MLMIFLAVSVLLIWVGWTDRHEAGYLPFILGIAWSLFTLASIGAKAAPERR